VAARAETSKRSLYAHFESKGQLFLADERDRGRAPAGGGGPLLQRDLRDAILGVEPPSDERPDEAAITNGVDVGAIRRVLADLPAGTALGSCALEKQ
jgi:AcrR family transcriptional regulator